MGFVYLKKISNVYKNKFSRTALKNMDVLDNL